MVEARSEDTKTIRTTEKYFSIKWEISKSYNIFEWYRYR